MFVVLRANPKPESVRRYVRNQYGISTSRLHGGIPTDRCVAEWWIRQPPQQVPVSERIDVPADIDEARAQQDEIATRFEDCFARGLTVIGMEDSSYLLGTLP